MFKMLVDTCVWLDLAKDPEQQPLLDVIEELIELNELSLIVPRTVLNEFVRNKARVIEDSQRSLSSHFKQVKQTMNKYGNPKKKKSVLQELNDIDHKIPLLGASFANQSVSRIEKLLGKEVVEISDDIMVKAAYRAVERKAPFQGKKNSIDDAIIIETYGMFLREANVPKQRFSFVTHNKNDFSNMQVNQKEPHPDIASFFTKRKSLYFINLAEAVHKVQPDLVSEKMVEQEWMYEPRNLSEIFEAENELIDKIWYNRHQNWLYKISKGKHKIIERSEYKEYNSNVTPRDIFEGARKSALKMEKKYGIENLGPWSDFEWGMLNGKLSALRWVLGEDWDELYT